MAAADEILNVLARFTEICDKLGVPWAVGGSLASSIYGEPRSTNDLDIVAALTIRNIPDFVAGLGADTYVDAMAIRDAIERNSSFNVIDERFFIKVDVFVPPEGPLGTGQLERRRRVEVGAGVHAWVLSPEDTVLQKLRWYRLGGEQSDRQWRDICSVIRLARAELDWEYLRRVAGDAGLGDLLDRAG